MDSVLRDIKELLWLSRHVRLERSSGQHELEATKFIESM